MRISIFPQIFVGDSGHRHMSFEKPNLIHLFFRQEEFSKAQIDQRKFHICFDLRCLSYLIKGHLPFCEVLQRVV